ncbi:MAG: gp436 family protein [Ferrovibrionaceae bacterium]
MAYATQADLIQAFSEIELVQLTDKVNMPPSTIDADRVEIALRDASGRVNAYVAGRYTVPLSPVPDEIRRVTCDLAWYYLHGSGVPEEVLTRHDRAVKFLREISEGVVVLVGAAGLAPAAGGGTVQLEAPARVFDRDSLSSMF